MYGELEYPLLPYGEAPCTLVICSCSSLSLAHMSAHFLHCDLQLPPGEQFAELPPNCMCVEVDVGLLELTKRGLSELVVVDTAALLCGSGNASPHVMPLLLFSGVVLRMLPSAGPHEVGVFRKGW